jgi:UDP-N-acetylmuramoyl-L-alanyl-D-glutamate--2,6-diaminopimelate ligase
MRLGALLDALSPVGATGDPAADVTGISYNTTTLRPGELFVAVAGTHVDGHDFAAKAVARGAAGLVVERPVTVSPDVPTIRVADTRLALAQLATAFFDAPSRDMWLAGITGTDGKTTSTELTAQLLEHVGIPTGFMTTVTLRTSGEPTPNLTRQTTLEAVEIQQGLAAMRAAGRRHAVLETTSHALALRKVEGCAFDVAGVTNVTHDHLDFHGSWDGYVHAKGRLFELLASKAGNQPAAVLNRDDASYQPLCRHVPTAARCLTYGLGPEVDVCADDLVIGPGGATFTLRTPWGAVPVDLPLIGQFNVYNALLAAIICLVKGVDLGSVARGLRTAKAVAGRMERIDEGQPFQVVVDYAHTPDSLRKVLTMLRQAAGAGRLFTVFGSAGERDLEKRPVMGAIAAELADFSVFTTEDPRFEDPMAIIEQIARGAMDAGKRADVDFLMVEDRRSAIAAALDRIGPGDLLLLAGKGHEQCIIVGNTKVPWDDRAVAAELLRARSW